MDISANNVNAANLQRPPTTQRPLQEQSEAAQTKANPTAQSTTSSATSPLTTTSEANTRIPEQPQKAEQPPLRDTLAPDASNNTANQQEGINDKAQNEQNDIRELVVQISVSQQQNERAERAREQDSRETAVATTNTQRQEPVALDQSSQASNAPQTNTNDTNKQEEAQELRQTELRQTQLRDSLADKFSQAIGDNSNPPSIDLNV